MNTMEKTNLIILIVLGPLVGTTENTYLNLALLMLFVIAFLGFLLGDKKKAGK